MFTRHQRILFQGDSITDAGRERSSADPNDAAGLGRGYPFLIMNRLLADYPELELSAWNRGISGNRVPDLHARWLEDCIELQPDVLSILIGVNDIWHKLEGRYAGTVEEYRTGYRELLTRTRSALPRVRLLLCEPFVLRCGVVTQHWFPEFDQRRAVAAELARAFDATFVPFQAVLDGAVSSGTKPEYWARDGVHPTPAGHQRLADAWLQSARSGGAAQASHSSGSASAAEALRHIESTAATAPTATSARVGVSAPQR